MSDTILSRLLGTLKSTFRISKATLSASGLTVARTFTLPDVSMTVAGLGDIQVLNWKAACYASAYTNINLASPGTTIDSLTMVAGYRVSVQGQTTAADNGVYDWNGAAVPMTRSADCDTADKLYQAITTVMYGANAGLSFQYRLGLAWVATETAGLSWKLFGYTSPAASEVAAGDAAIATQAETNTGTHDGHIVTPLKLATWSGRNKGPGDTLEINSDASSSGADWKYTLQRPTSGMAAAVTLTLPVDDGTPNQVLKTDGSGALAWIAPATGDALTTGKLSQFAATSSAELAGVLSNETGSGLVVFNDSPTLITPALGTPSAVVLTNGTALPIGTGVSGLGAAVATFLATPTLANFNTMLSDADMPTGSGPTIGQVVAIARQIVRY